MNKNKDMVNGKSVSYAGTYLSMFKLKVGSMFLNSLMENGELEGKIQSIIKIVLDIKISYI